MGEAVLTRISSRNKKSGVKKLVTEIITENTNWVAPDDVVDNSYTVRIFGGGGASSGVRTVDKNYTDVVLEFTAGGGGGYMNNKVITISPRTSVEIIIGAGGIYNSKKSTGLSGGITSFGNYLSASGGGGGGGIDIGSDKRGGTGGSGGGGYFLYAPTCSDPNNSDYSSTYLYIESLGGNGSQFGGGGSGLGSVSSGGSGGKGGTWGGKGGFFQWVDIYLAKNGTNTIGTEDDSIAGSGIGGGYGGGDGGYGGCGGKGSGFNKYNIKLPFTTGGGGGYGANGGDGASLDDVYIKWYKVDSNDNNSIINSGSDPADFFSAFGGGGGYGKQGKGGNGFVLSGGGYGAHGGGGGAYGPGGDDKTRPLYGGGGCYEKDGADGVCIIQYYKYE